MAVVVSAWSTDIPGVTDLAGVPLPLLLVEAARLEASQAGHFTTALADAERRYLDIMAELYARREMPGRRGCGPGRRCSCTREPGGQPPLSTAPARARRVLLGDLL